MKRCVIVEEIERKKREQNETVAGSGRRFKVKRLKNATIPAVGTVLDEHEVIALIDARVEVIVDTPRAVNR